MGERRRRSLVQRPTATRVLARLEEAGLIERTADPSDRRSTLVAISTSGRSLVNAVRERKDAYLVERLDLLSSDELATLDRAAGILERVLDE